MLPFALVLLVALLQQEVVQGSSWATTIDVAGKQRMLSQRMTKEFLLVASGMNVDANRLQLEKTMNEFNGSLGDLIYGNANRGISAAPNAVTLRRLQVVVKVWELFSQSITENLDAASLYNGTVDKGVIAKLVDSEAGNVKLLVTSNAVVGALVDAAKAAGAQVSGLVVDIAGRQRMLIQRMCKEALLVKLNVEVAANVRSLKVSSKLFDDSHYGIILGVPFAGISALASMCTLYQMREVTYHWEVFKPLVDEIVSAEDASINQEVASRLAEELIEKAGNLKTGLFSAMVKAVKLYVDPSTACNPLFDVNPDGSTGINDRAWTYLLNNVGKQRMLGQKASQLFTQIANGIAVESSKVEVIILMDTIERHIRSLIEGSRAQNIFAPPTQQILNELLGAYDAWTEMREGLEKSVNLKPDQFTEAQVGLVARMSEKVLEDVNRAVKLYEEACILVNSTVPARLINDAGRQRMVLMKMAKEAGLVQYGYQAEQNWQLLNETRTFFQDVHWMLLEGDNKAPGIPKTTNICIVQQMKTVYDLFLELDSWVLRVARGEKKDFWSSTETGRTGLLQESFNAMHKAVGYYANGVSSCDTLSVSSPEWEGMILGLSQLRTSGEKVAAQYFLLQAGDGSSTESVAAAVTELASIVRKIRFGSGVDSIPAPLTQEIFDDMISLENGFTALVEAIEASVSSIVSNKTANMVKHVDTLMASYVERAQRSATTNELQISRISKVARQPMLVQKMLRQAAQVRLKAGASMEELLSSISDFDESHDQLLNGGGGVQKVTEARPDLAKQWETIDAAWKSFKPVVQDFAQSGTKQQTLVNSAETLLVELEKAVSLYRQPDPEVPERPPPFPLMQIIYGIIGSVLVFILGGSCCYLFRQPSSPCRVLLSSCGTNQFGSFGKAFAEDMWESIPDVKQMWRSEASAGVMPTPDEDPPVAQATQDEGRRTENV